MIPKKNAAVCNGTTIVLYEMEGCNMAPKFKGFLPRFPRWAVYEMMLVFPFHTGHGFFHSIQVQSTGMCFVHFDFEICFAPQRRALFRHLNSQKWSAPLVFLTFRLGNVLRATACTFSSLIWPAGSAPAALASLLFDPPEPQFIGKTQ